MDLVEQSCGKPSFASDKHVEPQTPSRTLSNRNTNNYPVLDNYIHASTRNRTNFNRGDSFDRFQSMMFFSADTHKVLHEMALMRWSMAGSMSLMGETI